MDLRGLLSELKNIDDVIAERGINVTQTDLFEGFDKLSLDTSCTPEIQAYLFLEDLKTLKAFKPYNAEDSFFPVDLVNVEAERNEILISVKKILVDYANDNDLSLPENPDDMDALALLEEVQGAIYAKDYEKFNEPANSKSKNIQDYLFEQRLQMDFSFTHTDTFKVHKPQKPGEEFRDKHAATWYAKICEDRVIAAREVVIQEFFRLLMPYQPKTRLGKKDGMSYVLSKEIPGSSPFDFSAEASNDEKIALSREMRSKFESGEYKGMGSVMVPYLWLNEVDAKMTNMLLDEKGNIINIDGDWGLASLREDNDMDPETDFQITAKDVENLPFVDDYKPAGWADIYIQGEVNQNYFERADITLFDPHTFPNQTNFRREVNESMLQILVMPKEFIEHFVKAYLNDPVEIALITDTIMQRTMQLREAAILSTSFQHYIQSAAAIQDLEKHIQQIESFNTTGKNKILTGMPEAPEFFRQEFTGLKNEVVERFGVVLAAKATLGTSASPTSSNHQRPVNAGKNSENEYGLFARLQKLKTINEDPFAKENLAQVAPLSDEEHQRPGKKR